MRKTLKRLSLLGLILIGGYTISQSGFLEEVALPRLAAFLQLEELLQEEEASSLPTATSSDSLAPSGEGSSILGSANFNSRLILPAPEEVDTELIRSTILELTNDLRTEQGVGTLVENEKLERAADIRAVETAESFSHTRPDGRDFYTVLEEDEVQYLYTIAGENLAMGTYHLNDKQMAAFLFDGWVESDGHYKNMISPDYLEIGIGVHYDGEFLYLVQTFGTPFPGY